MSRSTRSGTRAGVGVRTALASVTLAGFLSVPVCMAAYADGATEFQLNIASQPLETALRDLAQQSGIQIVVQAGATAGHSAPVLNGQYSSASALRVLLQGTGLTFRQLDEQTIEVQTAAPARLVRTAIQEPASGSTPLLMAQNNAAQSQGPKPGAASQPEEKGQQVEEVVVTGSRIARADYSSLTPIVTVDAASIETRSDVGIESALQQLPQFRASGNASNLSGASNPFPSPTAAPGAATVDLRGLGTNRTLVLVDGRRAQPVNATLAVDLNTIPAEAIASVETITGGAASTYGADAISGVVNFKLKQNFQGIEVDAQQGISQHGDDKQTDISALLGGNFADNKGNLLAILNYSKRGTAPNRNRDWVRAGWNDPGTPGGGLGSSGLDEFVAVPASPFSPGNFPTAGFPLVAGSTYYIAQDGSIFDYLNPKSATHPYTGPIGGNSGFKINPTGELSYNNETYGDLVVPLTRWSALVNGHYTINDHITAFLESTFSRNQTEAVGVPSGLFSVWQISIPYNPLYDDPSSPTYENGPLGTAYHPVPQALATLLNSRPNPNATWTFNGSTGYFGPYKTDTTTDLYQVTAGLRGDLPVSDSTWEVYGSRGETTVNAQLNGFPNLPRLQNLFNASYYGKNYNIGSYPIGVGGSCTSGLPLFNANGSLALGALASADCGNYADPPLNNITHVLQQVYEGDIQGSLIEIPFLNAGKVKYALGADYRSEGFDFTPDSNYTFFQDFPNIVQNIALPGPVQGSTSATEVYTEFSIPLLKDLPLIKALEIDPGFRRSHYNETSQGVSGSGGDVNTWKMLANWTVANWVNVRGGIEVANRAPNIAELFTPTGGSALAFGAADPCATYNVTPSWGNVASNPNRYNVQALCQYLIERDAGSPANAAIAGSYMVPGGTANNYQYNVFGPSPNPFPFALAVTGGNPNLKSETARTITGGVVFTSPFSNPLAERLKLSVDWYQIKIDGAIGVPGFGTVYQECMDAKYNPIVGSAAGSVTGAAMAAGNPYCALIQREYAPAVGDPFGAPRKYKALYINQGGIQSRGIDTELDWGLRFADAGALAAIPGGFNVNIVASYLNRYAVSPFPGAAFINYTGTVTNSSYQYKLLSTFTYTFGPASVGFRWQHLPSTRADPSSGAGTLGAENSYNYVDMFGTWTLNDTIELRGGISNLFDAWPVWVGASPATRAVGQTTEDYDTQGRRFYLGLKAKF
jgi:iron complex outermembrane recepter protein